VTFHRDRTPRFPMAASFRSASVKKLARIVCDGRTRSEKNSPAL
jgi:hypothetical protein